MMGDAIPVRVLVLDTWDEIVLAPPVSTPLVEIKTRALEEAKIRRSPDQYQVKYLGASYADEATLAQVGVRPNGALIVMLRRRQPVR